MGSLGEKQISHKLRSIREQLGFTQQEVASKAGVSLSTYTKIEEGTTKRPSASVLFKLTSALQVSLDSLLDEQANPIPVSVKKPVIKFVYFDVGGVLVHTESAFLQPLSMRLNRPLDHVRHLYHRYIRTACLGKLSLEDMQWLMLLNLNVRFINQRKKDLFRHWVEDMKPCSEAHRFAAELSERCPLGLLTDTVDGWVEQMQAKKLIPDLGFKPIVKSNIVGMVKPDFGIYEYATKKAGVLKEQILFIDDRKLNVEGARNFGWQAEWFNELNPNASITRIKRKYF